MLIRPALVVRRRPKGNAFLTVTRLAARAVGTSLPALWRFVPSVRAPLGSRRQRPPFAEGVGGGVLQGAFRKIARLKARAVGSRVPGCRRSGPCAPSRRRLARHTRLCARFTEWRALRTGLLCPRLCAHPGFVTSGGRATFEWRAGWSRPWGVGRCLRHVRVAVMHLCSMLHAETPSPTLS